ncbi:vacuolar protein sorting-associated protein 45 [Mycoemilia scoparia]|uniref:Vacuolar protein sorting-associated protein 45 n=1 Tax=Mycoemilia scoparia TaxID=417184 RepID=A0A9W8DQ79_9FUNG|nr:vacuolar protein sorting-associated protein 45 [Mycoemilia scoparia]
MDIIRAVQSYVERMLSDTTGMKVLLLDEHTTPIVSVVATQSYLLSKETYLVDKVGNSNRDTLKHLKCVCFLRPTDESMMALAKELQAPRYGSYYVYFSNALKKSMIELLAEHDENELVQEVQEFYADYLAVDSHTFHFGMTPENMPIYLTANEWEASALDRCTQGLISVLLSLRKKPTIRYEANSRMAAKLAESVSYMVNREKTLFDFKPVEKPPPLLLILDRRNDPVTPLLLQWMYHAMVHELVGINNGLVDLTHVSGIKEELKQVVLSVDQDSFFKQSQYLNFGELGESIRDYVNNYQSKSQSQQKIESITDMKKFVESYPEFRKLSGNVTKHVTLVGELSRLVSDHHLLTVSELEQSLACNEQHKSDLEQVKALISNPGIRPVYKVKCVILYALRYEGLSTHATSELKQMLARSGVSPDMVSMVDTMLKFGGRRQRQGDLFENSNIFTRGINAIKGLKGVENVYTQHKPLLSQTLDLLIQGREHLKIQQLLPTYSPHGADGSRTHGAERYGQHGGGTSSMTALKDIIIFFVGGVTLEEEAVIAKINANPPLPGLNIVIGGTTIHNSASFLDELSTTFFP